MREQPTPRPATIAEDALPASPPVLPREDPRVPAEPVAAVPGTEGPLPRNRRRCLLVVEDEPMVLWLAVDLLREAGAEVLSAGTAAAALQFLDGDRTIDGALIDLGLPDMPGETLVLESRRRRPSMAIVVASGYGADVLAATLDVMNRIAFLDKPYDDRALREAFRSVGLDLTAPPDAGLIEPEPAQ